MTRQTVSLAIILLVALCITQCVNAQGTIKPGGVTAQGFTFDGQDVLMLAKTISVQANRTYELPGAYMIRLDGKTPTAVPAPVAFEILGRALIMWSATNATPRTTPFPAPADFPKKVTGVPWILKGPPADPTIEPPADRQMQIPVSTNDVFGNVLVWLKAAQTQKNVLLRRMTFESGYKLTAAQFLVAMAMVIDETQKSRKVPTTILVPAVHSPQSWEDTTTAIRIIDPIKMRVTVNGIVVPRTDEPIPPALLQPLCGAIPITVAAAGPIAGITVALDGRNVASYTAAGTYGYAIDSLALTDATHILSVSVTDTEDIAYPLILSLNIQNGRVSGFTPAELDTVATIGDTDIIYDGN